MKKFSISILLLLSVSTAAGKPSFRDQFYDYFYQGDYQGMETTLKTWETSCPDDVEMLAAYGSYFFNRAKRGRTALPGKLSPREDILLDGSLGKSDFGADPEALFDRKELERAVGYWKRAVLLYPERLDIRFWLARAYQEMDDFESQYQTLAQSLLYADKNKRKLRWNNDEALPVRRSQFIPETLQGFETYYFDQQKAAGDEKAFRLAKLTLTFFPRHPFAYNSIAAYYANKQDWEHTLKYLLLANEKDPQDSLVLTNIGNLLMRMDKRREARFYFEKVVKMNNDEGSADLAKEKLQELNQD